MVATVILGMLCVHLLCFCVMFLLISRRLHGQKMGMEVFALGNLLLGCAYLLQLLGGPADWGLASVVNHTLTLCAPVAYVLGALRFFGRPTPVALPLLALAALYSGAQVLVQHSLGDAARHALLAASCSLLFAAMVVTVLLGTRSFARHLRTEMLVFAVLVGGICVLNALKFHAIVTGGLPALAMDSRFQTVFYIYMSFLGTVLPPAVVWLVLRRLADALHTMAIQDPLTGLLNRRGLQAALDAHFAQRGATPAHLLLVDIDHFKRINDSHGHQAGDQVLCQVAQALQATARTGDLICRLGGEEFVLLALHTDGAGALQLAERLRTAIAACAIPLPMPTPASMPTSPAPVHCTATLGVSGPLTRAAQLDLHMQQADAALYRGKTAGRNRVEAAQAGGAQQDFFAPSTALPHTP